jgi:hypothetical protein
MLAGSGLVSRTLNTKDELTQMAHAFTECRTPSFLNLYTFSVFAPLREILKSNVSLTSTDTRRFALTIRVCSDMGNLNLASSVKRQGRHSVSATTLRGTVLLSCVVGE